MEQDASQNERIVRLETEFLNLKTILIEIKDQMVTKTEFNQVIENFDRYKNTTKQYHDEICGTQIKDIKIKLEKHEKRIDFNRMAIAVASGAIALFEFLTRFYK